MHIKTMDRYKACFDWLLKLLISFSVHLKATHMWLLPKNILILASQNKWVKSSFFLISSHCFSIILKQLFAWMLTASGK